MPPDRSELLQGTLDMLILKTLALRPMHGYGISQRLSQMSSDVFQVNQGSLYPALQRLERDGLVAAGWDVTENNRRARFYRLTRSGRGRLRSETEQWRRLSAAIEQVLETS